jgi:uncharacterized protein involved in exopolysaccharide biosynthesis
VAGTCPSISSKILIEKINKELQMDERFQKIDFKQMFRRRKKLFLLTFFIIFISGFSLAIALPPIYRSEALIRVEDQKISKDFVKPTISTGYVEERIEKLSQQILNRERLLAIIDKFDLYPEIKKGEKENEIINKIRKDISIQTISAEIKSESRGRTRSVTIAFSMAYEGKKPDKVQKVTDTLSKLYLEEDLKNREKLASVTSDFFESELKRLKDEIRTYENKISEFKKNHIGELPSDTDINLLTIARLERELDQTESRLRLLNEKAILIKAQLTNTKPLTPIVIDGEDLALNPKERLKKLRLQLATLQTKFSEKHPDIKKLKKEIEKLENSVESSENTVAKIKRLNHLENRLVVTESKLGSNHPDVKAIKKEILYIKEEIGPLDSKTKKLEISKESPDNPVYINLLAQVKSIKMEINELQNDKKHLVKEIEKYQTKVSNSPLIEKEFTEMTRDYESANNKYQDLYGKYMGAKVAQEMEGKQQGERFKLVSKAYLPSKPFKPNRLIIISLSLIIGITLSSFLMVIQESSDKSIKTIDQIKKITGIPVLTSIETIVTEQERKSIRVKRLIWSFICIGLVVAVLYCIDNYFIQLEQLGTIILDRLKMFA